MKLNYFDDQSLVCHIPKRLEEQAKDFFPTTKTKMNALKLYALIYTKNQKELKRGNEGLAYLSKNYLRMVFNSKYYHLKKFLIDNKFIGVKSKLVTQRRNYNSKKEYVGMQYTSLFEEDVMSETYKVGGYSKAYFTIENPTVNDPKYSFKITNTSELFKKNKNFINELNMKGLNPNITRDNFGFRLYSPLQFNYKEILNDEEFVYYDVKSSVPTLLRDYIVKSGFKDDPFVKDMYHGKFYDNWKKLFDLNKNNKQIKSNFMTFINLLVRMFTSRI